MLKDKNIAPQTIKLLRKVTLISTYLRSLLANSNVARFLSTQHGSIFKEFDSLIKAEAL